MARMLCIRQWEFYESSFFPACKSTQPNDTIVFDYNSQRTKKDYHLTIVTPQANLINSLTCYSIKYKEKKNII
ncbi:hypothetical protein H8356DRAFT_1326992 [Neocallimastix lanati (nom. inval.)]|nr:hypothetical protein H8356DRAFT_1326992 [Neocallimastix sp. JGI-2020a]